MESSDSENSEMGSIKIENDEMETDLTSNTPRETNLLIFDKFKNVKVFDPNNDEVLMEIKNIKLDIDINGSYRNVREPSISLYKNFLVFAGGKIDGKATNKFKWVDLTRQGLIIPLQDMIENRFGCSCVRLGGDFYAIGGVNEEERVLKAVEKWCGRTGEWKVVSPMNDKRVGHAALAYNNKIYVIGGFDSVLNYIPWVDVYDPSTDTWKICEEDVKPKYEKRYTRQTLATVLGNYIYVHETNVIERDVFSDHVYRFDPLNGKRCFLPRLPENHSCASLISFRNKLIYFGFRTNFEYDPETNSWGPFVYERREHENHIFPIGNFEN